VPERLHQGHARTAHRAIRRLDRGGAGSRRDRDADCRRVGAEDRAWLRRRPPDARLCRPGCCQLLGAGEGLSWRGADPGHQRTAGVEDGHQRLQEADEGSPHRASHRLDGGGPKQTGCYFGGRC
ncbi:unnamed protein product, partial [Symbiodinium sp. KB8]